MSPHVPAVRPRAVAIALAIILPLLVALTPGVASAQTAPAAGSAVAAPAPVAGASPGSRAVPRGVHMPWCGKRIWSSKYMKPETAKRFVTTFAELVKRTKNGSKAFAAASAVTGVGGIGGFVLSTIAGFAGDYLVNYVTDKFLKQFSLYKQVRFELKVKCFWGLAPKPSIGTRGLLKLR